MCFLEVNEASENAHCNREPALGMACCRRMYERLLDIINSLSKYLSNKHLMAAGPAGWNAKGL
jgi:hypothetical protein